MKILLSYMFFFSKREISLIQINDTLHLNIKTKVVKTLEDDTIFRLITRISGSRPTDEYLKYSFYPHVLFSLVFSIFMR